MSAVLVQAAVSPTVNTIGGQGWRQAGELGAALLLAGAIGLERELRRKDAGLRTHILVGVGAALFLLISKYGFTDVLEKGLIVVDPSRMAAQVVSGIGFLGAGLIFVRRGAVRGLTTAASIWVTAAVGSAAGAGLLVLAALTTGIYFVVTLLVLCIFKTSTGAKVRSVAVNERTSTLLGVNAGPVYLQTFFIAGLMAGAAGIIVGIAFNAVSYTMGESMMLQAFVVIVLGGLGSITGTVVASLLIGLIQTLSIAYVSSQLADAILFGLLFFVLWLYPSGLLIGLHTEQRVA